MKHPYRTPSAIALALALGFTAAPGWAQQAESPDQGGATLERIIVTGSAIKRVDTETASPVEVISADDIKKEGLTSVADVLQRVTANGMGTLSNANSEAFAGGASGVALRGLTVGATLVLIDGHRMAAYPLADDGERQFTDISNIPLDAIERIEVLKDGASAIYGSDAIAGVVNVILKKSYVGSYATGEWGTSQHGGGDMTHLSFTHGGGDLAADGFNAYFNFEFRSTEAISYAQRTNQAWDNTNWTFAGGNNLTPGASPFNPLPVTQYPYLYNGGPTTSASSFAFPNANCNYTALLSGQCTYPIPGNVLPPTQNLDLLGSITKKINDDWTLRFKASVFDSKGQQQLQGQFSIPFGYWAFPGPSFAGNQSNLPGIPSQLNVGAISSFTLPANYPGNTLGAGAIPEGAIPSMGLGYIDFDSRAYRFVADLDGNYKGWDLGASAGYTDVVTDRTFRNFVNYDNVYTALQNQSLLLTQPPSQSVLNFIAPTFESASTSLLSFVELRANKDLAQLSGGSLGFASGAQYFHRGLNNPNPTPIGEGYIGNTFSTYASGGQDNYALFAEFDAPVLKSLEFDVAGRVDRYDTYGDSFTPKAGIKWKPVDQFALRGTFSQGFRAPSSAENGSSGTLFGLGIVYPDPILCGTDNGKAYGQVPTSCTEEPGYLQTTNAKLKPERSDDYTLGIILEPIRGWSTTVDYYKIKLKDQIVTAAELSSYSFAANCVRGAALPTTISNGVGGLIIGTPLAGPIGYCLSTYINANTTETSGFDLNSRYRFRFGEPGDLTVDLTFTHEDSYVLTANGLSYELAGTHGPSGISGDTGNPRNRAQLTLSWDNGPYDVTLVANYISAFSVTDPSAINGIGTCQASILESALQFIGNASAPSNYCQVHSFTDTDLTLRYDVSKALNLHFTINNLFDREPPVDLQTYGGSFMPVNPALHAAGIIGRFFLAGATYKF